jgi:signal transduction histidine kinase
MTKIEVNKFYIQKEKFDLIEELRNLKETFSVAVKKKGLKILLDSPEKFVIYTDKKRINQILVNLIGNAVKFTDKGKISIKVKKSTGTAKISVKDTGPGIKAEDLAKLFKPFSRITEHGKAKEGSGLGLHLSKKLAILLGGNIFVKSKFGKGSKFTLSLKLEDKVSK